MRQGKSKAGPERTILVRVAQRVAVVRARPERAQHLGHRAQGGALGGVLAPGLGSGEGEQVGGGSGSLLGCPATPLGRLLIYLLLLLV